MNLQATLHVMEFSGWLRILLYPLAACLLLVGETLLVLGAYTSVVLGCGLVGVQSIEKKTLNI